ncbi:MAG: hypothetical protein IJJ85_08330 [Clostridia bacterium]|nr:hypothetical protein [Clostridia bacterium]
MTAAELIEKHGFHPIVLPDPERETEGCYIGDLLSWVMGKACAGNVWITIMSNVNTVAVASLSDVSLVLLAEGVTLEQSVAETALARGVNVASTDLPAFEAATAIAGDL